MSDEPKGRRAFPTTQWSLVLLARNDATVRAKGLQELLSIYWMPLYHFARRKGLTPEAAQDAIQGFFAQQLERDFLTRLDPGQGKLRTYLKTALSNYMINAREKQIAQKRGGDAVFVPMDFEVAESHLQSAPPSPEDAFDKIWARELMDRCFQQLRAEYETGARTGPFDLVLSMFRMEEMPPYTDIARDYGMTVPQVKSFLHRARDRFRKILLTEVQVTVSEPGEADGEIEELIRLLK